MASEAILVSIGAAVEDVAVVLDELGHDFIADILLLNGLKPRRHAAEEKADTSENI